MVAISDYVLETKGLTKVFGGVPANDAIDFQIQNHEIHALIGENGAGKSTFCKMLTGVYTPDAGTVYLFGEPVHFKTPAESMAAGIAMVYQERNLIGYLTGAQNICLNNEPCRGVRIDEDAVVEKANELRDKLQLKANMTVPVSELGAGEQQLVEIIRAFYNEPRLLILDEPTASLGEGEIKPFLDFVKELAKSLELAVIFISHKLDEVFYVADQVTVFTEGKKIFTKPVSEVTQDECVKAMLRSTSSMAPVVVPEKDYAKREKVLEVEALTMNGKRSELNLEAYAGETVGFYGLVGSGRTECFEALYGLTPCEAENYRFCGEPIRGGNSPGAMIRRGMIMTPEKRANGIFGALSLVDNIAALFLDKLCTKAGFFQRAAARTFAVDVLQKNKVKYKNEQQSISELSGGNMQKVIIGRSIDVENLKLLVVDEPTAGMDLGAKNEIYLKILRLVEEENICVAFISSELEELQAVCDRLYVFSEGSIVGCFSRSEFDRETILRLALKGAG